MTTLGISCRRSFGLFVILGWSLSIQCAAAAEAKPLPGGLMFPDDVQQAISQAWQNRVPDHQIRSRHRYADGAPHYTNRLILELSPYLNQHAHNPVDWHSWGDEAFELARRLDKPVLVSIGYSSCHWCHVMEEESYDDLTIAQLLNEHFIAIKVDREINPDIDELYLLAVQIMGGSGGWPLHAFLTPEGKPFLGLVYAPREEFEMLLNEVQKAWKDRRNEIETIAGQVTERIQTFGAPSGVKFKLSRAQVSQFIAELMIAEGQNDEFSPPTPHFPLESELFLLLDAAIRHDDDMALQLAENRLTEMAMGGIRDHVGGGFHRYSVDNDWLVPHFEKMLYNQAHLARAYLQAYELTGRDLYRRVAEQTLNYVLRDMRSEVGVFWSATDADSEGKEGAFFIWTVAEIVATIGDSAELVIDHYGVTENGNFEGANILHLEELPEARAAAAGIGTEAYLHQLTAAVEQLRMVRDLREKPYLDDKVITAWNAMMITTLVHAGSTLMDDRYLNAAQVAAEFLWTHAWQAETEHLYRIFRNGQLSESGKLRDYAYLAQSLLTLYDATGEARWLDRGQSLVDAMVRRFWDERHGGFFSVSEADAPGLIARQKDRFDEALPSGNAVAASALSMLFRRTGQQVYARLTEQLFQAFAAEIVQAPTSYGYTLKALEYHRGGAVGPLEYAASGHAKISLRAKNQKEDRLSAMVEVALADGWHIQSNQPLADNLIATQISPASDAWLLQSVHYPPAEEKTLSFQTEPLSVWSGTLQFPIEAQSIGEPDSPLRLEIRLQACNDELCLLPEDVQLEMPVGWFTG